VPAAWWSAGGLVECRRLFSLPRADVAECDNWTLSGSASAGGLVECRRLAALRCGWVAREYYVCCMGWGEHCVARGALCSNAPCPPGYQHRGDGGEMYGVRDIEMYNQCSQIGAPGAHSGGRGRKAVVVVFVAPELDSGPFRIHPPGLACPGGCNTTAFLPPRPLWRPAPHPPSIRSRKRPGPPEEGPFPADQTA
jgi:hypothetical protein